MSASPETIGGAATTTRLPSGRCAQREGAARTGFGGTPAVGEVIDAANLGSGSGGMLPGDDRDRFYAELRELKIPSLVIHGAKDASAPLAFTANRTVELHANAQLAVYEDAPHGLPLTHRNRLVEDVTAFARAGTRAECRRFRLQGMNWRMQDCAYA